jgi:ABC-type nickel/cobalt efflux system permease component RcnA
MRILRPFRERRVEQAFSPAPAVVKKFMRAILLAIPLFCRLAYAHPMGNFSISHYTGIRVESGSIEVTYVIDMAEIPTYQEIQENGIVATPGDPSLSPYLAKKAELFANGLTLELSGRTLNLHPVSSSAIFPAGAGGLPTMKMGFVYRAAINASSTGSLNSVHYRDDNFPGRAGWKEIVVTAAPGFLLADSTAPGTDRSAELSNYPTDLLNSPPQDLEADFHFAGTLVTQSGSKPVGNTIARGAAVRTDAPTEPSTVSPVNESRAIAPPVRLRANSQPTPRSRFTELVTAPNLSFWFLLTAALIAAGLGALHALEPGHGKTIVAAYLVGSKGTARHAVFLGLIVTGAHTAGVYLLGAITLAASKYIVPERLYPWLEMVSGITIAVFAVYLTIRAWTGEDSSHSHKIGASHSHWFNRMGRTSTEEGSQTANQVSLKQLLTLGITGGMVPCPAALVVLLGAFSLHRVGFGLFLIVAFSLGLAAVLVTIGLFMVYAKRIVSRWNGGGSILMRWLPVVSSGFMLILGLGIAGRAFLSTGVASSFLAQAKLPSFVGVVLLGLFLGMRHSTDPDHVIAVSTITSRERSVGKGAMIGVLWGVGHTLTICVVGSAIILFGLAIPPRVGLSMEFSVALMLILLGVLNLTGVLRWLSERLTPVNQNNTGTVVGGSLERVMSRYGAYQIFRPLLVGLVHGLAGSAAVALLVLSTIRSPAWAIAYLVIFGIGTVMGMMLMTSAMALPVVWTGKHFDAFGRYLSPLSGVVSAAFGLFLAYQICFVDGLFLGSVHWTPQ